MGRKPVADMTPAELAECREKRRLEARQRRASRTPEQVAKENAAAAKRSFAAYRDMTDKQRAARNRRNYRRDRDAIASATPEAVAAHRAKRKEIHERWYAKNRDTVVASMRARRRAAPKAKRNQALEEARVRSAKWRDSMTDEEKREVVAYQSKWIMDRKKTDPAFRVLLDIRSRIRRAVERRGIDRADVRTADLFGCSVEEFAAHIERQFVEGMTWGNKCRQTWHIDHIVPLAAFDLSDEREARIAAHYLNHRPAFAADNLKKSAKMPSRDEIPKPLLKMLLDLDPKFFSRSTYRRRASSLAP